MRINFIKQPLASSRLPRCDPCERQESHHPEAFPRSIVLDWRAPRSMLIDCQNYFGLNSKLSADLRTKMHVRTLKKTRLQAGAIFHRTHRGCPSPAHSPRRNRTARGSVPATGYQEVPPYCGAECNLDRSLVARVVSLRARARAREWRFTDTFALESVKSGTLSRSAGSPQWRRREGLSRDLPTVIDAPRLAKDAASVLTLLRLAIVLERLSLRERARARARASVRRHLVARLLLPKSIRVRVRRR